MNICWYCLAMVLISTIVGALLMYLFNNVGRKRIVEERDMYMRESNLSKDNLNKVTNEYNEYKAHASKSIEDKDADINKLNKLNLSLSRAPQPKYTQAQLDHKYIKWKKRSEDLSNELEYIKAKVDSKSKKSNAIDSQILDDVKSQLSTALKKIRQQDIQLKEAQAQITLKSKTKGTGKKKKKIRKLKAELEALKSKYSTKSKKKK